MNLSPQPERAHLFGKPSVSGARYFARESAIARMIAAGRATPNADDTKFLHAETARLLFQVEDRDGGFMGLSDSQLERRADELGIPSEIACEAVWHAAPKAWPGSERIAA